MNQTTIPVPRSSLWRRTSASVAVLGVIVALLSPAHATSAVAQTAPGLEALGELDTGDVVLSSVSVKMLAVDASARRLYVAIKAKGEQFRIAEYDLRPEIPSLVRMTEPFLNPALRASESTVAVDTGRNRLILLTEVGTANIPTVVMVDLDTLTETTDDSFEVAQKVPGFRPLGLTYSSENDRIYLVGKWEANSNAASMFKLTGTTSPTSGIVALDGASGSLVWANALRQCEDPLNSASGGAMIGLSRRNPVLYTFCSGRRDASQLTGQSGLLRLDITNEAGVQGPADFPAEFFPVSGSYDGGISVTGVAGFDAGTERVIVQSLSSQTHGAWVFDGLRSSWLGFVAAPDNNADLLGIDRATGKHYMAGGDSQRSAPGDEFGGLGYLNVTDASTTPVPQGQLFDRIMMPSGHESGRLVPESHILVDSHTGRLFFGAAADTATAEDTKPVYRFLIPVLRDTTPPITPPGPLDLDALTQELSDDEARLEFAANTSGFGAQYITVGGWENVYTRARVPLFAFPITDFTGDNPANIRYGNRGASMSFVDRLGIASSGSVATAIATQPDENTPADTENKTRDVTEPLPGDGDGSVEETARVTCLDGIGESITSEEGSEEEPAHTVVTCDLENFETTAHTRFSGGSGGGGVAVSNSLFDGRTYRDPELGTVVEATAMAEGISFGEVDLGGMSIDRVTSTVTTVANGLEGSTHVRWVRTVEGAQTYDANGTAGDEASCTTTVESGKEVTEEGDCELLQEKLNDLMPTRFEVKFPLPEIEATPKGAFASVQESESDFLSGKATNNDQSRAVPGMEMTVFADGPQRGRLWVQLAAVQADATFIRSPIQSFEPFGGSTGSADSADDAGTTDTQATGGQTTDGGQTTSGVPSYSGDSSVPPAIADGPPVVADVAGVSTDRPEVATDEILGVVVASHEQRVVGAFGWLPALRSLGDALLTGALYLLFLLPIAEIVRRRRLLGVLTDVGPGDESSVSVSRSSARAAT
jgi:hypothetical protein